MEMTAVSVWRRGNQVHGKYSRDFLALLFFSFFFLPGGFHEAGRHITWHYMPEIDCANLVFPLVPLTSSGFFLDGTILGLLGKYDASSREIGVLNNWAHTQGSSSPPFPILLLPVTVPAAGSACPLLAIQPRNSTVVWPWCSSIQNQQISNTSFLG